MQSAVVQVKNDTMLETDQWEPEKPVKRQISVAIQSGIVRETTKRYEERPKNTEQLSLSSSSNLQKSNNHFACIKEIFKGNDHKKSDHFHKGSRVVAVRNKSENTERNLANTLTHNSALRAVNDANIDSETCISKFVDKKQEVLSYNNSANDCLNKEPSYYLIHNTIDGQVLVETPPKSPPDAYLSRVSRPSTDVTETGVWRARRDGCVGGKSQRSGSEIKNRELTLDVVHEERKENSKSGGIDTRNSNSLVARTDRNSSSQLVSPGLITSTVAAAAVEDERISVYGDNMQNSKQKEELELNSCKEGTVLVGTTKEITNSVNEANRSEKQKMDGGESLSLTIFNDPRYASGVSSSNCDELQQNDGLQHSKESKSNTPEVLGTVEEEQLTPAGTSISDRNRLDGVPLVSVNDSVHSLSINGKEISFDEITSCDLNSYVEQSSIENDNPQLDPRNPMKPYHDESSVDTNHGRISCFSLHKVEERDDVGIEESTCVMNQNENVDLPKTEKGDVTRGICESHENKIERANDFTVADAIIEDQKQIDSALNILPSKVKAYGEGLRCGVVGEENIFELDTSLAEYGELGVHVVGPHADAVTNTAIFATDETADTLQVRYTVSAAGLYKIYLTWDEHDIAGSPFVANVAEKLTSSSIGETS
ncbi:Filamin/ABP280 repeat-like [Trinorchestia longiramus]|nr:Filamin/ABP280 repeat-like [Trinorchestia longiramus]